MKIFVVSDIHGNAAALKSLWKRIAGDCDALWVLGDSTGYGPDNEKVIRLLMKWNALILPGNHDLCLAGVESKYRLSEDSRRAMDLIQLPEDLKEEIRRWPRTQEKESITLVHGAASDPIWNYILDKPTAIREFKEIRTSHCFFGHSHNPGIFRLSAGEIEWIVPQMGKSYPLKNCRALVNPGSLGQPRDGDSRSSFMIFDTVKRCVTFYRNTYSVKRTQRKMIKRGFPPFLIDRLSKGI